MCFPLCLSLTWPRFQAPRSAVSALGARGLGSWDGRVCAVCSGSRVSSRHHICGEGQASAGAHPPTGPSVSGDAALYRTLTTLARALGQYLLVFSRLPSHLHLPPEKERDTVKFVVTTLEVSRSSGTRAQSGRKSEGAAHRGRSPLRLNPRAVLA